MTRIVSGAPAGLGAGGLFGRTGLLVVVCLLACLAGAGINLAHAQDGVFSPGQAERGRRIFADECPPATRSGKPLI